MHILHFDPQGKKVEFDVLCQQRLVDVDEMKWLDLMFLNLDSQGYEFCVHSSVNSGQNVMKIEGN